MSTGSAFSARRRVRKVVRTIRVGGGKLQIKTVGAEINGTGTRIADARQCRTYWRSWRCNGGSLEGELHA